jgi:hypothetical protein
VSYFPKVQSINDIHGNIEWEEIAAGYVNGLFEKQHLGESRKDDQGQTEM